MQIDMTVYRRVLRMDQQKANRLRVVQSLPGSAEDGDMVLMDGVLHVYSERRWQNMDDAVQSDISALTERVEALEGE